MKKIRTCLTALMWMTFTIAGCVTQPQRNFLDQDLLFEASSMPAGWELVEANEVSSGDTQGQISGAFKTYYNASIPYWARLGETVYRYAKVSQAKWHFGRMEKELFNDQAYYTTTPWQSPAEFTFASQSADQWRFECAGSNFLYEDDVDCLYLAQYDRFIVRMTFTHQAKGKESLSLEDIQRIVTHVDELVTHTLSETAR